MSKILWIDDNSTITELVKAELVNQGHSVEVWPSFEDQPLLVEAWDLIVLDLYVERVDESETVVSTELGLNYFLRIMEDPHARELAETGQLKILLLSQHLSEYSLRRSIQGLAKERSDLRAYLKSKTERVQSFGNRRQAMAAVIASALAAGPAPLLRQEVDSLSGKRVEQDYFNISLSRFRALPDYQQAELQDLAITRVSSAAQDAFKSDPRADWLLFCGDPRRPLESGSTTDAPTTLSRRRLAEAHDRPTLVINRGGSPAVVIEEAKRADWWLRRLTRRDEEPASVQPDRLLVVGDGGEHLSCDGVMHDYPTLHLELAGRVRTFHFDTGADTNFLRVSQVKEHGVPLSVEDREPFDGEYGRYYVYQLPKRSVQCILKDRVTGNEIGVFLEGLAVEPFGNWPHARRCRDASCSRGEGDALCLVRSGLIGRRILSDNPLIVTLNGTTHTSAVEYDDLES